MGLNFKTLEAGIFTSSCNYVAYIPGGLDWSLPYQCFLSRVCLLSLNCFCLLSLNCVGTGDGWTTDCERDGPTQESSQSCLLASEISF